MDMPEYIRKEYGNPETDNQAIIALTKMFSDLYGKHVLTTMVEQGIEEQYFLIKARGLPAYSWMAQAFHIVSKKKGEKRTFRYIVGMLRQWLKWGYGHLPSDEEEEIVDYFEEVTEEPISMEARDIIKRLMGEYGAIKVTRTIGDFRSGSNKSKHFAMILERILEEKYTEVENPIESKSEHP